MSRQFRHCRSNFVQVRAIDLQREQIGVREVTIVVRVLLASHRTSLVAIRIVEARLLTHRTAVGNEFDLTLHLEIDRAFEKTKRVEILDFAACPEGGRSGRTDRYVRIHAKRSLLHVAVADI